MVIASKIAAILNLCKLDQKQMYHTFIIVIFVTTDPGHISKDTKLNQPPISEYKTNAYSKAARFRKIQ